MGKLILEVFGAVTGLLYVYLEIRHRRSMWLVGLIMAVCYMVVFGTERLYASAALYLYYFIISIYGWFRWRAAGESQGPEVRHISGKELWLSAGLLLVIFAILWQIMARFTDNPHPLCDAAVTTLNIVATWLLTRSIIEQWFLLMAANVLAVGLYLSTGLYPTAFLFVVYFIASVTGYVRWRRNISYIC